MTSVVIKSNNQEQVARAVSAYVIQLRGEHPEIERVIWFGSRVNGLPTPGSDVDICLVIVSTDKTWRDRVPDYLPVGFPVGIDLFVYTQEELAHLREISPDWYATIIAGREL